MEQIGLTTVENCPLCRDRKRRVCWDLGGASYFKCAQCGLVYQSPILSASSLEKMYGDCSYYIKDQTENAKVGYSNYGRFDHAWFAKKQLQAINRYHPQRGVILDIGCATGEFLSYTQQAGWSSLGLEISEWACKQAQEKGLDVRQIDLLHARLEEKAVDVITLFDVIEHVADPISYLHECRRILKPNGLLVIETPNIRALSTRIYSKPSIILQPHAHVVLFSPSTIQGALATSNFKILELRTLPLCRSYTKGLLWIVSVLAKKGLSRLDYQVAKWNIRGWFKNPDDTRFPQLSTNDIIRVVATPRQ